MSTDYFSPRPRSRPTRTRRRRTPRSSKFKAAGVDSMQVNIRGGSHDEFSLHPRHDGPGPLGQASLRGHHMTAFYTRAWLDKYVRARAAPARRRAGGRDARLLTDRWRNDPRTLAIDPNADGPERVQLLLPLALRHRASPRAATPSATTCARVARPWAPTAARRTSPTSTTRRTADTGPGPGPGPDTDGDGDPRRVRLLPVGPGPGPTAARAAGASRARSSRPALRPHRSHGRGHRDATAARHRGRRPRSAGDRDTLGPASVGRATAAATG